MQVELRAPQRAFGQPAFQRDLGPPVLGHQGDGICHCDSERKPDPGKAPLFNVEVIDSPFCAIIKPRLAALPGNVQAQLKPRLGGCFGEGTVQDPLSLFKLGCTSSNLPSATFKGFSNNKPERKPEAQIPQQGSQGFKRRP